MNASIHTITSTLLSRAKAHERGAWERLVECYGPLVYHWCLKKGLSAEQSKDVSQDVFAAVSRKLADYQDETFGGWLRRITHNKIIDFWKKEQQQPHAVGGSDNQQIILELPAGAEEESPDDDQDDDHFLAMSLIQAVSSEFSPRDLLAFRLLVLDEKTAAKVAEELKITLNQVYLAKSRILGRLREKIHKSNDP